MQKLIFFVQPLWIPFSRTLGKPSRKKKPHRNPPGKRPGLTRSSKRCHRSSSSSPCWGPKRKKAKECSKLKAWPKREITSRGTKLGTRGNRWERLVVGILGGLSIFLNSLQHIWGFENVGGILGSKLYILLIFGEFTHPTFNRKSSLMSILKP